MMKLPTSNARQNNKSIFTMSIIVAIFIGIVLLAPNSLADTRIQLIIDGRNITESAVPVISNNRTLVPVRVVSEELGAKVTWNGEDRTVYVANGNRSVLMRIDKNLVEYTIDGVKQYNLSDAAPQIINSRTFVPIRLISNALGVGIHWDAENRSVLVDSTEASSITPFFDMKILSVKPNETITGATALQVLLPDNGITGAAEVKFLVITPDTGKGFVIARGNDIGAAYQWLPSIRDNGDKVLAAAVYDTNGKLLAGDAIPLQIKIVPDAELTGLVKNQTIQSPVRIGANLNFSAAYIKYEIKNLDNGKTLLIDEQDPLGNYEWAPSMEFNGNVTIKVIAFDQKGQSYSSVEIPVKVDVPRILSLTGVKSGQVIEAPVNLSVSRNFDVIETEYILRDVLTGQEQSIAKLAYGSYTWFPGSGISGNKEIYALVKAVDGSSYTSGPIPVYIKGEPKLIIQGVGPDQVITSPSGVNIKVLSNTTLSGIKYVITNAKTGLQKTIGELQDVTQGFTFVPKQGDGGTWKLKAIGTYNAGRTTITTEEVQVVIYTGKIYSAVPIIEKSKFLDMASQLAINDSKKSGMSAALQTAQSILETGWGQSVPVDKYTGQLSYNLFGIKGTGTAGYVISNTWEEYNGLKYRIDAKFKAYNSVAESWVDHNRLLLNGARYEPYRKVMYDSSLGAWALKRAGYATDSKYPVKLMKIIELYQLEELDKISL